MKEIKLSQGKMALVSDEDFEQVNAFKWTYHVGGTNKKGYAVRNLSQKGKRTWVRLHRFIMNLPPISLPDSLVVDHINGDGLDNRRENLEVISQSENAARSNRRRKKSSEPHL